MKALVTAFNWCFSEGIDFHSQNNSEKKGPELTFKFSFLVLGS
jgi:hypothetical protein